MGLVINWIRNLITFLHIINVLRSVCFSKFRYNTNTHASQCITQRNTTSHLVTSTLNLYICLQRLSHWNRMMPSRVLLASSSTLETVFKIFCHILISGGGERGGREGRLILFFFQSASQSTLMEARQVDLLNPSVYLIGKDGWPPLSLVANSIRGNNGERERLV